MAKYCGSCLRYNDLFFDPPICGAHILSYFFDDNKNAKDCPEYIARYEDFDFEDDDESQENEDEE